MGARWNFLRSTPDVHQATSPAAATGTYQNLVALLTAHMTETYRLEAAFSDCFEAQTILLD